MQHSKKYDSFHSYSRILVFSRILERNDKKMRPLLTTQNSFFHSHFLHATSDILSHFSGFLLLLFPVNYTWFDDKNPTNSVSPPLNHFNPHHGKIMLLQRGFALTDPSWWISWQRPGAALSSSENRSSFYCWAVRPQQVSLFEAIEPVVSYSVLPLFLEGGGLAESTLSLGIVAPETNEMFPFLQISRTHTQFYFLPPLRVPPPSSVLVWKYAAHRVSRMLFWYYIAHCFQFCWSSASLGSNGRIFWSAVHAKTLA